MTAHHGFLGGLSAEDRATLLGAARVRRYAAGAVMIVEGDAAAEVFVVLSGRATAMRLSPEARVISFRDIGPGDLLGEIAALDGGPRSADVVARTELEAARLPTAAFEAALAASPGLSRALLRQFAGQLRLMTDRVFEKSTLSVRDRLIHELLRIARRGDDGAARLSPAPTHADIAARIGGHREGVTKELSALAARGLIRREGRTLLIPSPERLADALSPGLKAAAPMVS